MLVSGALGIRRPRSQNSCMPCGHLCRAALADTRGKMRIKSTNCPKCGTVVMQDFLRTHIQFVHGDGAKIPHGHSNKNSNQQNNKLDSKPQKSIKKPDESISKYPSKIGKTKSAKWNQKDLLEITVIEKRFVTVPEQKKRPKNEEINRLFLAKIVPVRRGKYLCASCGRSMTENDLKAHIRLGNCSRPNSRAPSIDEPSASIRAFSGGLPSLGKRSR